MEAATREAVPATTPAAVRGLPPGPRMPRGLQTAIWSRQAQWMLEQSRARFGDMFTIRIANEGTWVMLSDPELVKQVFTGDPKVFHAGEGNQILRPILGDNSVLVLDETPHISQRKLLLPPFHGERMQGYGETMSEIAAREIESWPTGTPYKLRPRMQAITLEIILETVFGVHDKARLDPLRAALRDFLDLTTNPLLLAPVLLVGPSRIRRIPAFRRRVDRVDELIYREIAERRVAEDLAERDDILSVLVAARHEDGSPMSDAEIRDELLTLLVAGHETTATALSWAVERLARHPEKLERLRAEALAGGDEPYLTATIQETLRLRPVIVLVIRKLTEPVELGGYELPAGVSATPCISPDPPPPGDLPRTGPLPARALPRQPARHLHLDSLRRRRPPLPRRRLRPVRDGRRPKSWSNSTRSPRPTRSQSAPSAAPSPRPRHDAEVILG